MTKEELEKEAEEYADTVKCEWENDTYWVDCRDKVTDAYLASAEPREKQIQIDARQIRALQKQNGELTDKVKELEAQIEKMKCCENCKHHRFCGDVLECKIIDCNNLESWELTFGVSN